MVAVALALPGALAAMAAAGQSVELRWKLEAETDLVYRTTVLSETELPQGMGTTTMRMEITARWSVLEVDGDGNAGVRVTTDRARMSLDGPMGTISADSADETGSGPPFDAVRAIADMTYAVTLDPRGALVGMSGVQEMKETLRARTSDPSAQAMIDQMLDEEALRGQWAQGMSTFPADAVGVGSSWENTFEWPLPAIGSMTVTAAHELESRDGDVVVIGSSGTISLADDAEASPGIPVKFGDATMTGTNRFDAGRGLLLGSESTMALEMTVAMGGQETVLNMVTTATLELVEE